MSEILYMKKLLTILTFLFVFLFTFVQKAGCEELPQILTHQIL